MINRKKPPPIYQAIPLSPDDFLQVEAISSILGVTIDLEGMAFNAQGDIVPFKETLTLGAAVTLTTFRIQLGYSFILSAALLTHSLGIPDGACYCRLNLVGKESGGVFPVRKLLAQGYVSSVSSIGYGSSSINGAPGENSYVDNIAVTNPAPGADFLFVCPNFTRLTILFLEFELLTDATVISRFPALELIRPPANPINFTCRDTVPAANSRNYMFGQFGDSITSIFDRQSWISLGNLILEPGSSIRSRVISIQAGDQVNGISVYCKRQTIPFN